MLTNVWKPVVLSSLTQLLTEKLFVVSSTGAPASAYPPAPSVVSAPPRRPGPQPAPPFSVAGCAPALSAAVVPLPSSNAQCPASAEAGSAAAAVTGTAQHSAKAASTAMGRRSLRSMTLPRVGAEAALSRESAAYALAGPSGDEALQDDEDEQEGPGDDRGPPGVEGAVEGDQRLDDAQHHDPEHGAQHVAGAAGEDGAADDDRGDRGQFEADAVERVAGGLVEHQQQAAECRADAADRVHRDLGAAGLETHQHRRLRVAADRIHRAPEPREGQHVGGDGDD